MRDTKPTIPDALFDLSFDHRAQVRFCAQHLELMRNELKEAWWNYAEHKAAHGNRCTDCWTREKADLAAYLIRHASESSNYPATVDFVTEGALRSIVQKKATHTARHTGISHLMQWELFTHEHMVPGSAALHLLTNRAIATASVAQMLEGFSYRALITGTSKKRTKGVPNGELGKLDAKFKARLPEQDELPGWAKGQGLSSIPTQYYGLIRYEVAGLLNDLRPVSVRAQELLKEYLAFAQGLAVTQG